MAFQPQNISRDLDSAFNLTVTYRRDSDVIRRFGDLESTIRNARFGTQKARSKQFSYRCKIAQATTI